MPRTRRVRLPRPGGGPSVTLDGREAGGGGGKSNRSGSGQLDLGTGPVGYGKYVKKRLALHKEPAVFTGKPAGLTAKSNYYFFFKPNSISRSFRNSPAVMSTSFLGLSDVTQLSKAAKLISERGCMKNGTE